MLKKRDILNKDVYLINGKRIGIVKDILFNFNERKMIGILIKGRSFFRNRLISSKDIISINKIIIVNNFSEFSFIKFSDIVGMDVYDNHDKLIGNINDILISNKTLEIKAVLCNIGIIKNILSGKEIVPIENTILGDGYLLWNNYSNIVLKSILHKFGDGESTYEQEK